MGSDISGNEDKNCDRKRFRKNPELREETMKIKKILYPTDFSEPAETAFEYAVFMATSHKADLALLHVVDQLHGPTYYEVLAITPMEIAEKMVRRAHKDL
jgi:nucleotide-binding universal stress UspA family protein